MGSNRLDRGREGAEFKGAGSTYVIPGDDMPGGLQSGKRYKMIIEGILSQDEQGGMIAVERIYAEEINSRDDPLQKEIEEEIKIEEKDNQNK
jgi:hypothetical protein